MCTSLHIVYLIVKIVFMKVAKCSSSDPSSALCLTQDIPRCTTFLCYSVILDSLFLPKHSHKHTSNTELLAL